MCFAPRTWMRSHSGIVVLSALLLVAVTSRVSASPPAYFGEWRISGQAATDAVSALSQDQVDHLIGSTITIGRHRFVLDGVVHSNPQYALSSVKSIIDPGYTIVLDHSLLRFRKPITQITVYQTTESNWIAIFFLSSDGRLLYYRGGVSFSLARIHPSPNQ